MFTKLRKEFYWNMIYKICSRELWQQAVDAGEFTGAEIDLADGYIHFSAAHQVRETLAKHFSGRMDLVLIAVDEATLGPALKWEISRGGDSFPHLYGVLTIASVGSVQDLELGTDGGHVLPRLG